MFRMTKRQAILSALAALLGVSAVILTVAGRVGWAEAIAVLLLTASVLLLVDIRRRQGDLAVRLRAVERLSLNTKRRQDETLKRLVGSSLVAISKNQWGLRKDMRERLRTATATILGSIETERLDAEDRHRESVNRIDGLEKHMQSSPDETSNRLNDISKDLSTSLSRHIDKIIKDQTERLVKAGYDETRQVEALLQLFRKIEGQAPMPPSGQWAMSPSGILQLVALMETRRPKLVVELGSGTSTVWIAQTLKTNRLGRVVSIDHDPHYAAITREFLQLHGLDEYGEVREAPLSLLTLGDDEFAWYQRSVFADLTDIDLLVIDGPPARSSREARYPALPTLRDRLSSDAIVVLDDASREDEARIVERWCAEFDGLSRHSAVLGNVSVLSFSAAPGRRE